MRYASSGLCGRSIAAHHPAVGDLGLSPRCGEDVAEVERLRLLQLRVTAGGGLAVLTPAHELRRVPEAGALEIVVADLDDPLRPQRYEREVLLGVPAAAALGRPRVLGRPVPRVL